MNTTAAGEAPVDQGVGRLEPERVIAGMPRTEYMLRRLLAHRVSGALGYYDDGELQDNLKPPFIDFLRDHLKDIELKLMERSKTPNARVTGPQQREKNHED